MRPQGIRLAPAGGARYEPQDIKVSYVVGMGIGVFGVLLALGLFAAWLEPRLFRGGHGDKAPVMTVAGRPPMVELPSGPRLETSEGAAYETMRRAWDVELTSYGRSADGAWHIPVEQAMALLAARGLPTRLPVGRQPSGGRP
jgi:hypothetical protein